MIQEDEVKCVAQTGRRRGKLLTWGKSGRAAWRSLYGVKFEKSKRNRGLRIWVDPEEVGRVQGASGRGNSSSK